MAAKKLDADPKAFLDAVAPAQRRRDALALLDLMREATGLEPRMSGSTIVGFGEYAYEYDSGRKGTAPAVAFAPRKAATVVYLLDGLGNHDAALAKLGPHTTGVGCLYLKDLSKVDLRVLKAIVQQSFTSLTKGVHGKHAPDAAETKASKTRATKATGGSAAGAIDAYLARIENAAARVTLTQLCAQLRELLPSATETISYGMPAFRLPNGKVAAGFAFFGKNCGYYPHSGGVVPKLGSLLARYKKTTGGITFPPDAPLPKKVVSALVRARISEIAEKERRSESEKKLAKRAPKTAKRAPKTAKRAPKTAKRAPKTAKRTSARE